MGGLAVTWLSKWKNTFETKDEGLRTFHVWVKSPQMEPWAIKQPFLDQYDVTWHTLYSISEIPKPG